MEAITHREYMMRLAYLEEELNHPSRTDQYLMFVAYHIRNVLNQKRWPNFRVSDYLLSFVGKKAKPKPKPMTEAEKETVTKRAKATWFTRLGIGRK